MALSGDCAPQFTTLAKFVRELRSEITELFTQVLLTWDAQGLIGRQMFAIDGVKLPSNAAKKRSGTHAELKRGDCYDNAARESWNHSYKVESIHGARFATRWQAQKTTTDYIDRYYNV